jgi:hypothetical protein
MIQKSFVKIKVDGISQVAIAVKNIEEVAENFWKILGIGPWMVFNWEAPLVYDRKYKGARSEAREKIAITQVGDCWLELVQPVEGASIYADFIEEQGEGYHHLQFLTEDVDGTSQILIDQGFESIQSGRFGPVKHNGTYNYIDMPQMGAIWEPAHIGEEIGAEPLMYPDATGERPAKIKVKGINQVAIAVHDLEKTAMNYWNTFGIGPWMIFDWEAPLVYDRKYHGRPVETREKIALTQVGDVQLELVQPVEGQSIYKDWLDDHGESIHHINFIVDDVGESSEILTSLGFESIQSGRFGPIKYNGAYNYIEIPPLRTIWEPAHIGEEIGAEPRMFPE